MFSKQSQVNSAARPLQASLRGGYPAAGGVRSIRPFLGQITVFRFDFSPGGTMMHRGKRTLVDGVVIDPKSGPDRGLIGV